MFTWKDYYTVDHMRMDQLKESEDYRLAKLAAGQNRSRARWLLMKMLGWTGTLMVRWGDELIGRCEDMAQAGYTRTPQSNL